jgi:hypothetical protein
VEDGNRPHVMRVQEPRVVDSASHKKKKTIRHRFFWMGCLGSDSLWDQTPRTMRKMIRWGCTLQASSRMYWMKTISQHSMYVLMQLTTRYLSSIFIPPDEFNPNNMRMPKIIHRTENLYYIGGIPRCCRNKNKSNRKLKKDLRARQNH